MVEPEETDSDGQGVETVSKYTTELRYICETYAGASKEVAYGKINTVLEAARQKLFSFDYPIFDYAYKKPLETKIMRHFYMREIGLETVGQFKFFLEMKMNEIMPYYNQLYESELIKFDPMHDFDFSETSQKKGSGNDSKSSTGSMKSGSQTDSDKWNTGKTTGTETSSGNVTGSGTDGQDRTRSENDNTTGQESKDTTTHDGKDVTTSGNGTVTKTTSNNETVTGNSTTEDNGQHSLTGNDVQNDTGTVKDAGDNTKWNYFHDTPQGNLNDITNANYLTNATKDTEDLKNTRTNDLTKETSRQEDGTNKNTQIVNGKTTTESSGNGKDVSETSGTETVTADGTVKVVGNSTETTEKSGTDNVDGTWSSNEDSTGNTQTSGTSEGHETGKVVNAGTQETMGNVTGEYTTLDDYIRHVAGKSQGKSYSQMLAEFRSTFLNIDMMVIDDLEELFMGIY